MLLSTIFSRSRSIAGLLLLCVSALPITAQPKRIVSTAPGITEMLYALGLGDRVVGVTTYCTYPPETAKVAKIGTFAKPDLEAILSVRPDLVIVLKTAIHSRQQYDSTKLKLLEVELTSVSQIKSALHTIGQATGVPERAAKLAASIQDQIDQIRRKVSSRPPTSVMYVVGRSPNTLEGLIVAGRGSYLGDIIALAGGRNIFADAPTEYPKVSIEEVLARDPDVIVDLGDHPDPNQITPEQQRATVVLWSRYSGLKAVRNKRIRAVASTIYVVPGPRVVQAAREFARILHPDLFRD